MVQYWSLIMLLFYWSGISLFAFKRWRTYGIILSIGGLTGYFIFFERTPYLILPVVLLFLSISLALIELFVPGFGFFGISSIIILLMAIVIGQFELIKPALEMAVTFMAGSLLFIVLKIKGYEMDMGSRFILKTTLNKSAGFSSRHLNDHLKGLEGVTQTSLRPAGKMLIHSDSEMIDVESERGMIRPNTLVKITRVKDNIVYVVPIERKNTN